MELEILSSLDSGTGFKIFPIHYSMDPEKTDAWAETERAKYLHPHTWDREMEIDFTAVSGVRAYPSFTRVNLADDLVVNPLLPLCLCCDFNVDPFVWPVAQMVKGTVRLLTEITLRPGNIDGMVQEFRNRFPSHQAEVWVYGDASGTKRTAQTARTDYQLIKNAFRGYSAPLVMKVPMRNPSPRDRMNALNNKMKNSDGEIGILINRKTCPMLVADLLEVVLSPDGRDVKKVYDRNDPYHERTHASDALGYYIFREWPIRNEAALRAKKKTQPLKYKKYMGIAGL